MPVIVLVNVSPEDNASFYVAWGVAAGQAGRQGELEAARQGSGDLRGRVEAS